MMVVDNGKDQEGTDHDDPLQLSLLQRLDRLDYLMQAMEGRHYCSSGHSSPSIQMASGTEDGEENHPAKNVSTVLEEVQSKGTLIERVAILEDRLLQLNLEIEASNVSKSSSSVAATEKVESSTSNVPVAVQNNQEKPQQPVPTQVCACGKGMMDGVECSMMKSRRRRWSIFNGRKLSCCSPRWDVLHVNSSLK